VFRIVAYWSVLLLSIIFVIVALGVFAATYIDIKAHLDTIQGKNWTDILPVLTLLLTAITTFAAVFFGWRIDRRQSKELELKIIELEHKLSQSVEQST